MSAAAHVPADKMLHFIGGELLMLVGFLIAGPLCGTFLCFALGLAKEVWDHYHPPHVAEPLDLLATMLGGVFMLICLAGVAN